MRILHFSREYFVVVYIYALVPCGGGGGRMREDWLMD